MRPVFVTSFVTLATWQRILNIKKPKLYLIRSVFDHFLKPTSKKKLSLTPLVAQNLLLSSMVCTNVFDKHI